MLYPVVLSASLGRPAAPSASITFFICTAFACWAVLTSGFSVTTEKVTWARSGVPITLPLPVAWITFTAAVSAGAASTLTIQVIATITMATVRRENFFIIII